MDNFTEIVYESWGSRIKNALIGVLIGLVLFIISFPLLFWNEERAIERSRTLEEGKSAAKTVSPYKVISSNDGKLIHMSAKADSDKILRDPLFGVSAKTLRLKRLVLMYQWKEKKKTRSRKRLGGGKETINTYTYEKVWSCKRIRSSKFRIRDGHENPSFPYKSKRKSAKKIRLGTYLMSPGLIDKLDNFEPLMIKKKIRISSSVKGKVKCYQDGIFIGENSKTPQIGDLWIKFKVVRPGTVSIIAAQKGNTFEPYRTKNGGSIELLQTGKRSVDRMIKRAHTDNNTKTWSIRFTGFLMMFIGLFLVLRPFSVFADIVPFIGDILGAGAAIVSLLTSIVLSLITIAVAWIMNIF